MSTTFDGTKHTTDIVAEQYLKQASTHVQHLVPVEVVADGNCLFNSIVSLIPDSNVSAVELRGSSYPFELYRQVLLINSSVKF